MPKHRPPFHEGDEVCYYCPGEGWEKFTRTVKECFYDEFHNWSVIADPGRSKGMDAKDKAENFMLIKAAQPEVTIADAAARLIGRDTKPEAAAAAEGKPDECLPDEAALDEKLRTSYRIITNGQDYKIQKYQLCGMLSWQRFDWVTVQAPDLYGCIGDLTVYSLKAAQDYIESFIKAAKAEAHGWTVVE